MEHHPNFFCINSEFEHEVVFMLNNHLFNNKVNNLSGTSIRISHLYDIYSDMRENFDRTDIFRLYHVDGNCLKNVSLGNLCFGHDLPVWLNDPYISDCKIMIVGYSPRRNNNEMYDLNCTIPQLSISSPFGIHSPYWRNGPNGSFPRAIIEIIENAKQMYGKTISVYFTDMVKLYNAMSKVPYSPHFMKILLNDEITLFNPDIILLMGKNVLRNFGLTNNVPYFSIQTINGIIYIPIPHPSNANKKEIEEVKKRLGYINVDTQEFFVEELCKHIKEVCCRR